MVYKTLMLQLYNPSKHKRDIINHALLHYSQALQFLVDRYQDKIKDLAESKIDVGQQLILNMIDKETAKNLNQFNAQPFKDSLKIEFAAIAASYIAQKRNHSNTRYPLLFLEASRYQLEASDCINQFDNSQIGRRNLEQHCSKLIDQVGKLHSIYFGRYALNRNYCLLYDRFKDRFYAKLYLLNREESIPNSNWTSGLSLEHIWHPMQPLLNKPGKKSFLILPLSFGKKQYDVLKEALVNPDVLHSARLVKRENQYYLMVNVDCDRSNPIETITTMGISRNVSGGLNYTICNEDGKVIQHDRIFESPNQNILFRYSNRIAGIATANCSQVILEKNGGRNDRVSVQNPDKASCLSAGQYASLSNILKYKLPEKNLPPPVTVSANGLFLTCPNCGARTQRNLITNELFICIHCGYASESEWIGSENLAKKLFQYRSDKIPITILKKDDCFLCYNKILEFECTLPLGITDNTRMYEELRRFIKNMDGKYIRDSKKYAVWKKLFQTPNLKDSIRLILK